jgi:hypothetical protein
VTQDWRLFEQALVAYFVTHRVGLVYVAGMSGSRGRPLSRGQ